jgi:hypothetical protein
MIKSMNIAVVAHGTRMDDISPEAHTLVTLL